MQPPRGTLTGSWDASNGIYRGFVVTVPSEDAVPMFEAAGIRSGTRTTRMATTHRRSRGSILAEFAGNPSMRDEMAADLPAVMAALSGDVAKSAQTSAEILREYWTRQGHPGPTQYALEEKIRWGEPDDWYRCVDELGKYIGDGAKGYCNLRHHEVLGYWPAQHAAREAAGTEFQ